MTDTSTPDLHDHAGDDHAGHDHPMRPAPWRHPRPLVPLTVGAVGLTVISAIQFWPVRHEIEHDLTARSSTALQDAELPDVSVTFTGRDAVIRGTVDTSAQAQRAQELVQEVDGVRQAKVQLAVRTATPSTQTPSQTPSTTPTQSASETPTSTPSETPTSSPSSTTTSSPTSTPTQTQTQTQDQTPPSVSAVFTNGGVSLTGAVPSEASRSALVEAIGAALPGIGIEDRLLVDDSVSDRGLDQFAAMLAPFASLTSGEATVTYQGGGVTLSGDAPSAEAAAAASAAAILVAGDAKGVTSTLKPAQGPAEDPLKVLTSALEAAPALTFESDSCTLTSADRAAARELATAILTASAGPVDAARLKLLVAGHADSRGPAAYNVELSRCRAQAMVRTLTSLGVSRDLLTVRAFGESRPVASNRTPEGRAANRRVELHLTS